MKDEDEIARGVRVARLGHGANCSSIGSVIDTLFASAVVGTAVIAALAAAMGREERVVVVGDGEGEGDGDGDGDGNGEHEHGKNRDGGAP